MSIRSHSFLPVPLRVKNGWLSGRVAPSRVDPARWRDPPHVYLANLGLNSTIDSEGALLFTKHYGLLTNDEDLTLKNDWLNMEGGNFGCDLAMFTHVLRIHQLTLRAAWRGDEHQVAAMRGHPPIESFPRNTRGNLPIEIHSQGNKIEAVTPDLWTFICVLFTRDHAEKRLKVCKNPACPAPYFVATRHRQTFCSHKCAVLINVHRFRQRQRAQRRKKKKAQTRKRRGTRR